MVKTVTATFRNGENGYAGMQDTCMLNIANYTNLNFGRSPRLDLGDASPQDRRMLFRFNLAGLAGKYSSIESITLLMREVTNNPSSRAAAASAYRISSANKDWVEGTATTTGGGANPGEPCWNYKAYSETSPTNWAGSRGLGTAGTDYDATPLGTFSVTTTDGQLYALNVAPADPALRKELVDQWSGNQADNAGIVIFGPPSGAFYAFSSDYAVTNFRPRLVVEYVPAGNPVAVFQNGFHGFNPIEDTCTVNIGGYTNKNFGKSPRMDAANTSTKRYGLMRFSLGGIMDGQFSAIDSIVLTNLWWYQAGSGAANLAFEAHRLAPANKDWVEGTATSTDGSINPGEPCWNYKAYSATSPTNWAGSAGPAGSADYESEALGTQAVPAWDSTTVLGLPMAAGAPARRRSLVAEWDGPKADNAGIRLSVPVASNAWDMYFHSSDSTDAAKRPRLEIGYTPSPTKTVTFRNGENGYAGMQDTCMLNIAAYTNKNFGRSPRLDCTAEPRKILMRFDLSSLRGNYRAIRRLKLTFWDSEINAATASGDVTAYRIRPANKDWVQGTATTTGGSENTGESCWNWKKYNTVSWAGSPGLATAGTDYDATPLGSTPVTVSMDGQFTLELGNAKSLVDEWSGPQADNAGIVLTFSSYELYLSSSDHATVGKRPQLEVEYVPFKGTLILFR